MPKVEMTTMVMLRDERTGRVLVQDRVKSWKGLAFPGGHLEDGESVIDCAVREVREETGLEVAGLCACGIVHWVNRGTMDRYMVFLFRASEYAGELIPETEEGRNFWLSPEELEARPSENSFKSYLPMFTDGNYSEAYASWYEDEPWEMVFR